MDSLPLRILLVEDSADDYLLTRSALDEVGGRRFALDWASTYDSALALMRRNQHDVYLLDISLGPRSGLDLLREAVEGGCSGPIIILTGHADYEVDVATMEAGAADYLVKGQIEPQLLERAIRYAVVQKRGELALRRAQEQLQEAIRTRDDFVAAVSHDLKGPITTIQGVAQLLQRRVGSPRGVDTERLLRDLTRIEAATTKMTRLINELLDVARLQSGQALPLEYRPTELVALARTLAAEYQERTARHTIRVDAESAAVVGQWNTFRLERVLDNLLSNAIKYSPAGGEIVLAIRTEQDAAGTWAVLVVRDHGVGIPAADLPKVFERFYRAANVGRIGGSGIGLAGSRQIVEQHGGTITVASEPGAGTAFTLRLPLAGRAPAGSGAGPDPAPPP